MRKKVLSIILGMAMLSGSPCGMWQNGGDTVQNNTAAESEASAETVDPDTEKYRNRIGGNSVSNYNFPCIRW